MLLGKRQGRRKRQLPSTGPSGGNQLKLSHHLLCEPISQLNDLRLSCSSDQQFILILEAYYSDLYPEVVCPKLNKLDDSRLHKLTGSQLVNIFKQLYTPGASASPPLLPQAKYLLKLNPTLNYSSGGRPPFCLDDSLKESFQAKCSGRQRCKFSRHLDHQFPPCVNLKPGHVFVRYLCIDDALLIKYCNANAQLASHTSVANRVKRQAAFGPGLGIGGEPSGPRQVDTLDFGFVASPGYPNFYATPRDSSCGWTIEAELNQRITIKLLDASLAPRESSRVISNNELAINSNFPFELANGGEISADPSKRRAASISSQAAALNLGGPEQLTTSASNYNDSAGKLIFKLDEHDYELIKNNLALRLQQVSTQCQGYDQLIIRDPTILIDRRNFIVTEQLANNRALSEFELITKLPIKLFENHLIDFSSSGQNETAVRFFSGNSKKIDYQALLNSLNPLQLVWLYQQNITLCSMNQLESLTSTQLRSKISFTSQYGNVMKLQLISGHMFNPLNRGVLFWYHKHGCPATRRVPPRVKLVFRNETHEMFSCYDGFVFNDTRLNFRVRECSPDDQAWRDAPAYSGNIKVLDRPDTTTANNLDSNNVDDLQNNVEDSSDIDQNPLPGCIYVEELANQLAAESQAKFDRLTSSSNSMSSSYPTSSGLSPMHKAPSSNPAAANEVAVEVVGLTNSPGPGNADEVDLLNQLHNLDQQKASLANSTQFAPTGSGVWQNVLNYLTLQDINSSADSQKNRETHLSIKQQQAGDLRSITSQLLDRRFIIPAFAILFLFVLLNLLIYVIFIVALPKLARALLCSSNSKTSHHHHHQNHYKSSNSKLSHYESDYSVSMGMSL